jgi:hypothetical protein
MSMPLSSIPSPMPAAAFDRPMTLPLFAPLATRLDAALFVIPVVTAIARDPVVEALEQPFGLGSAGLVSRRVRVADGRRLTVVGVPSSVWGETAKAALLTLKSAAAQVGRRVLLVPEGALDREPRMSDALLVAGCSGLAVSPTDRLSLGLALIEAGGSLPLVDAAECMARADDPVAAVLALVAGRVVGLDLGQALGPESRVLALEGRTFFLRGGR